LHEDQQVSLVFLHDISMVFVVQSVTDKFVYRFSVQLWKRRPERWAKLLLLGPIRYDQIPGFLSVPTYPYGYTEPEKLYGVCSG